jgi:hypothetical protein
MHLPAFGAIVRLEGLGKSTELGALLDGAFVTARHVRPWTLQEDTAAELMALVRSYAVGCSS